MYTCKIPLHKSLYVFNMLPSYTCVNSRTEYYPMEKHMDAYIYNYIKEFSQTQEVGNYRHLVCTTEILDRDPTKIVINYRPIYHTFTYTVGLDSL